MTHELFGSYELIEQLGTGGMATVFRARCRRGSMSRIVAIKRIHGHLARDPQFIRMFLDEARIAAALAHPSIVELLDLGSVDGQHYMVLEHVHGRDLSVLFKRQHGRGEAMPIAQTCYLGMELCAGLEHVHQRRDAEGRALGLVHRDVSLPNLLLSFEGELKIIDFGIALAESRAAITDTGTIKGKLAYMSPEQITGHAVDHRSDIFSAGIVLFELLTGKRLFLADNPRAIADRIRAGQVPRLYEHDPRIPEALDRIVHKALTRDPDERYQSARELGDALLGFVHEHDQHLSRMQMATWIQGLCSNEYAAEVARLATFRHIGLPQAWSTPALPKTPSATPHTSQSGHTELTSLETSLWEDEPTLPHCRERFRPRLPLPPEPEEPGSLAAAKTAHAALARPFAARPVPVHACPEAMSTLPLSMPGTRKSPHRLHAPPARQPTHRACARTARPHRSPRPAGARPWSAFLLMLVALATYSSTLG